MSYSGKTYLITGASAGIGKGFAEELHGRGADVVLVARREEQLRELCDAFNGAREGSASYLALDLGDVSSADGGCRKLEQFIRSHPIHGLVNNAGFGSFGQFEELDIERESEMVRVNVTAPLRLSHAVAPQMLERHDGVIINLASIAGFQPIPYMGTYAATKAFDLFLSLSLHHEYRKRGVRVLAVCPGPIRTEFAKVAAVPGGFKDTPGDVVETVVLSSLQAVEKNRAILLPGRYGRLFGWGSRCTPRWLNMWLVTKMLEGRTG